MAVGSSPGNRTETVIGTLLLTAFVGFLFLFVEDARNNDALATTGRVLHWAAGAGIAVTIIITRTVLRRWTSGFDWIFAAMWALLTILTWMNGDL
ncbi:hypothetical protein [Streptomyces sp. NPDC058308]|uniref:hypothetical protein n=1 Tax=Streptomyces sp. NPDC058308 TaxID=3346440 RepID=UPI0036EF33D1